MDDSPSVVGGTFLKVRHFESPNSDFNFIDGLLNKGRGPVTARDPILEYLTPTHRLLSLARIHEAKSIVIETIQPTGLLLEEDEDLRKKLGRKYRAETQRWAFFTDALVPEDCCDEQKVKEALEKVKDALDKAKNTLEAEALPDKKPADPVFLGYAIIRIHPEYTERTEPRIDQRIQVFEAVIRSSIYSDNRITGEKPFDCNVLGNIFHIDGHFFGQQNGVTTTCAHMVLRNVLAQYDKHLSFRRMNEIAIAKRQKTLKEKREERRKQSSRPTDKDFREEQKRESLKRLDEDIVKREDGLYSERLLAEDVLAVLEDQHLSYFKDLYYKDDGNPVLPRTHLIKEKIRWEAKRASQCFPFRKLLYASVESGYPSILAFKRKSDETEPIVNENAHLVTVIGHTFNEDTWVPRAESFHFFEEVSQDLKHLPSEFWVSTYIAHDDICGPSYCIPRDYLYLNPECKLQRKRENRATGVCVSVDDCVSYVIGTFPEDVKFDPIEAEAFASQHLHGILRTEEALKYGGLWMRRLKTFALDKSRLKTIAVDKNIVLRPVLIKKARYISHLKSMHDWSKGKEKLYPRYLEMMKNWLPDAPLWMVEFSLPEMFGNKRKLGEILFLAGDSKRAKDSRFLAARLPGSLAVLKDPGLKESATRGVEYEAHETNVKSHVELF